MELTKINRHGQISIPAGMRKKLSLHAGDFIQVEIDNSLARLILVPVSVVQKKGDPLREYERRGVDLTLLEQNLSRTPEERVKNHRRMWELVQEARRAGIKDKS
ncbi:MAG: AbrB/MazE/SpoVT family DNA-binding domain-containing protein [Deltaproteobacteria bacterium]|nr:AbrB/MazE/SpoVT family DNA-binding domain-containing protein [Deltaproteobacteria bacterium]